MKKRALLEMSVDTLDAAITAMRAGADRIELCENLSIGGTTPPESLMRAARQRIRLPIFVMIRPRGGDFHYAADEFEQMKADIELAKSAEMDGVVLGLLTRQGQVDVERTRQAVELAKPLPATFHRAFDDTADLERGLEDVLSAGVTRILTSGGVATAEAGCSEIARLVGQARGRITILPGGGVQPDNLSRIARVTRANEFHSGLSTLRRGDRGQGEFEAGVRELVRILEEEVRNLQPTSPAD